MHHSINLHENIGVSDSVRAETEIDAVIYRSEFEKYYQEYVKTKSETDLIFSFIFLQIYIECFLHQNMRRIVEMEFKSPRDFIRTKWLQEKEERRYVPEKLDNFGCLFFAPVLINVQQLIETIKHRFVGISHNRNLLAHGHKVASWSDSDGGSGITSARSILTENKIKQTIEELNELGSAWNALLDSILPHCKALRHVDDFKFLNL